MNTQVDNPSAESQPSSPDSSTRRGRPRKLDDVKRGEICALIAGGCGLRDAARYVRCDLATIRREAKRNPDFHDQLRRSEAYAQLSPLRAMQSAVAPTLKTPAKRPSDLRPATIDDFTDALRECISIFSRNAPTKTPSVTPSSDNNR